MIKKKHDKESMAVQEKKKRGSMKRKVINETNIRGEKDKY